MIDFSHYKHVIFKKSNTFYYDSEFNPHSQSALEIVPVQRDGVYFINYFRYSFNSDTQQETYVNVTDVSNSVLRDFVNLILNADNTFRDINNFIETNQISNDRLLTNVVISRSTSSGNNVENTNSQSSVIFSPFSIYENPIDNSNVFQILNGISQVWSTALSDDDYKKIEAIEAYNNNFIKWYSIFNSSDVSSGSSSDVDLSTINTQLTNISNKLSADVLVDDNPEPENVSITQSIVNLSEQLQEINERPVVINNENLDPWSNA